jgi:hypothetical protein
MFYVEIYAGGMIGCEYMNEKPLLEIDSVEAAILADWLSIKYDLVFVVSAAKHLYDLLDMNKNNEDQVLLRSLWTAALVTYIRCFTSGKRRSRLDPEIFEGLNGDPIGTHQYYKDTRDKHIAHPVNIFEEIKIGVLPSESFPEQPAINGLGHLYSYRLTDDKEGVKQLGMLASFAIKHVENEIKKAEAVVMGKINNFTEDDFNKLTPLRIQPLGGAEAAQKPRMP